MTGGGVIQGGVLVHFLVIVGCESAVEDEVLPLEGEIVSNGERGVVRGGSGFAAERDGRLVAVVYARTDITCELAGEDLGNGGSDWDPSTVLEAGTCGLSVLTDFDGSLSLEGGTIYDATVSVSCAMGEGTWEFREKQGSNPAGYFYSGSWWQGSPELFDLAISGDEESGYTFEVAMDTYEGQFIYDLVEADKDPGEGEVTGGLSLEPCAEIGGLL